MGTEILRLPAMPRSLASSLKTCNKTTIKRGKIGKGGNTALFHLGCLCFSRNARVAALTGLTVSVFEDQKGSIFSTRKCFPEGIGVQQAALPTSSRLTLVNLPSGQAFHGFSKFSYSQFT